MFIDALRSLLLAVDARDEIPPAGGDHERVT